MKTYNVSYEKASHIVYSSADNLTLDELKMRVDNPDIGKLPDWLSETCLSNTIWKTIHSHRDFYALSLYTDEDLYQELQLFVRIKSNHIVNYPCLKAMLSNYIKNILADSKVYFNYFPTSLDLPLFDDSGVTKSDYLYKEMNDKNSFNSTALEFKDKKSDELINLIKTIKDDNMRKFLIVIGYFLCELDILEDLYNELYLNSPEDVKKGLDEIREKSEFNCILAMNDGVYNGKKVRRKVITIETIIKSLKLNKSNSEFTGMTATNILNEFRYFIKSTNLLSSNA